MARVIIDRDKKINQSIEQITHTLDQIMSLWTEKTILALRREGFNDKEIVFIMHEATHS